MNPAILGVISGVGLLLKTFSEIIDYKKKIEMSKFAHTTYDKALVDLRASLRGAEFNHTQFIFERKTIDTVITAICPLADKFEKYYNKKIPF